MSTHPQPETTSLIPSQRHPTTYGAVKQSKLGVGAGAGVKPGRIPKKTGKQHQRPSKSKNVAPEVSKLGTFDGVFLPTTLNVLSILMFLRFGFIIGQMGVVGTFLLLFMSYFINILTTMSISAISTNGTVKGGGAYYMISRSLGPEFGGAIGIVFFIGQILNSSLNVVGFIEPLLLNFNEKSGTIAHILPVGYFWQILYSTVLLAVCTGIALVGSKLVSKTALLLFIILTLSTLSIPLSTLFVRPFNPLPPPFDDIRYSGISWTTFMENLWPHFTSGAAGSVLPKGQPETFKNLFGIFFPATAGIFAGASMSGELKTPSKSIPKGTLNGLLVSFILYSLVILSMGGAIPRKLLHKDIEVLQTVNLNGMVILLGEFSTSLFSVIMGIVGSATMLSAIADDRIIPGLSVFTTAKRKTPQEKRKGEIAAIFLTWIIAQAFLFADINQIATFITMAFLMTFIVTNLACFLLRVGSAPNFRPSFKYFSSRTAFTGALSSILAMYIVDGISATSAIIFLIILIMLIHYMAPPLKFGDISQLLIYHQVRKYLLRLKLQMSVKYWRPQILLLCDDPRSCWNLIGFCNHLKKGGLYILGHVVLMNDDTSSNSKVEREFNVQTFKEVRKQRQAWAKLRDISKIKAFVQIAIGPTLPWGVRNVYLGSGLGGMRPNITVLGFYDFVKHGMEFPLIPYDNKNANKIFQLPTDDCRKEKKISITQWVQIVEDLIIMQATVAVAGNFLQLDLPTHSEERTQYRAHPGKFHFWSKPDLSDDTEVKYIDLYPIQMSSINLMEDGKSVLSTNFDTYTLILQLGAILSTVPEWKFTSHILRVVVFVELEDEVEDEQKRLSELLSSLRIDAQIKVVCLNDGSLSSYNFIVKGFNVTPHNKAEFDKFDTVLQHDQWWKNLCNARSTLKNLERQRVAKKKQLMRFSQPIVNDSSSTLHGDESTSSLKSLGFGLSKSPLTEINIKNSDLKKNRRYTLSNLHGNGLSLSLNMKSQGDNFFKYDDYSVDSSSSSSSDTEKDEYGDTDDGYAYSESSDASERSEYPTVHQANNALVPPQSPAVKARLTPSSTLRPTAMKPKNPVDNILNQELRFSAKNLSSDQLSIRSSRSNLRPNFLSVKIPQSQINDDDDDDDGEDNVEQDEADVQKKTTIRFVDDEDLSEGSEEEDDVEVEEQDNYNIKNEAEPKPELLKPNPRIITTPKNSTDRGYFDLKLEDKPKKAPSSAKKTLTSAASGLRSPSIISNNDEIIHHMKTPTFLAVEDEDEGLSSLESSNINLPSLAEGQINSRSSTTKGKPKSADYQKDAFTRRHLREELKNLTFNDLPAKGQHLILNDLMKTISPKERTAVIFSTLPAPAIGTHLDYEESFDFTHNLAIWLNDLPPTLLVNSQTVTVTTSL